jgi:hypothetical protein
MYPRTRTHIPELFSRYEQGETLLSLLPSELRQLIPKYAEQCSYIVDTFRRGDDTVIGISPGRSIGWINFPVRRGTITIRDVVDLVGAVIAGDTSVSLRVRADYTMRVSRRGRVDVYVIDMDGWSRIVQDLHVCVDLIEALLQAAGA